MLCEYRPPRRTSSRPESRNSPFWGLWPFLLVSAAPGARGQTRTNSVLNILTVFSQNAEPLVRRRIHVYGNALDARQRGNEHVPIGFVLRKVQKVILTIDFKLQFLFSLKSVAPASRRLFGGRLALGGGHRSDSSPVRRRYSENLAGEGARATQNLPTFGRPERVEDPPTH